MANIIVFFLLLSPVELPAPHHASPACWQALKWIAERWEITGPHERWIDDFQSEVRYVRRHLRELRDAPSLAECAWLPPRQLALGLHAFCLQRQLYLEQLRPLKLHHQDELDLLLAEARRETHVWMLIDCATNECQPWPCRRRALRELGQLP